jgi:hypothetical protein
MSNTTFVIIRKLINILREPTLTVVTCGLWGFAWAAAARYRKFDR